MAEHIIHEDPTMVQWLEPDPTGGVLRTRYKDTQQILDENAGHRANAPKKFRQDGVDFHHVCNVPWEVYDLIRRRLGHDPSADELIKFSQDRDFSKLKTREVKL